MKNSTIHFSALWDNEGYNKFFKIQFLKQKLKTIRSFIPYFLHLTGNILKILQCTVALRSTRLTHAEHQRLLTVNNHG